jgi:hypothetical protein
MNPIRLNGKISNLGLLLGFALLGSTLSGCGPNLASDEAVDGQTGPGLYDYAQSDDAGFACPSAPNVLPPGGSAAGGTPGYTACPDRSDPTSIKLVGYSATSRMICAYPVQFINATQFIYKLDPNYQPLYTCYDGWAGDSDAVAVNFPTTGFNGVVVVDQGSRPQMSACLMSGQPCPPYSLGRFRQ